MSEFDPVEFPLLDRLSKGRPRLYVNPLLRPYPEVVRDLPLGVHDVQDAEARLRRFAPLLEQLFPELSPSKGLIESELIPFAVLETKEGQRAGGAILEAIWARYMDIAQDAGAIPADFFKGQFFFKADHMLPVAGSVKARGGIYEVLCFVEELAVNSGLLAVDGNYLALQAPEAKKLFAQYTISVGSTGNLGISTGLMARALGFRAVVHMSREAKTWKKLLLREHDVQVIEHKSDYSGAVRQARMQAAADPYVYFVDDESSQRLFLGYSVAGCRLRKQLDQRQIVVDRDHPLFVYLPCGVGGAPGGITFGLKSAYGDRVHCFFAEPTQAPCMTLAFSSGQGNRLSIYDLGLNLQTVADGLAVGQASALVFDLVKHLVAGCFTVTDKQLFVFLSVLADYGLKAEPSALAGCVGPGWLLSAQGVKYLREQHLIDRLGQASHVIWLTGGSLMPEREFELLLKDSCSMV